jgi:DNA-binding XRE family transcriptional regulator
MRKELKRKIKIYCAENSITQKELCKQIGVSPAQLHYLINQRGINVLDNVIALMNKVDVTIEDFEFFEK